MARPMLLRNIMAVTSHEQLQFWQLLDQLRQHVITFTSHDPAAKDRDFCNSARRTIASACRNTAEGFARYSHPEFAQHVNIALGELAETCDHFEEALQRKYIAREEHAAMRKTAEHARATGVNLLRYLRRTRTPVART